MVFQQIDKLYLNTGNNGVGFIEIDKSNGFLYAGCAGTSHIVKVRLSDFTQIGAIATSTSYKQSSSIDTINGFLYAGSNQVPPYVVKIRLSDFAEVTPALSLGEGTIALYPNIDIANGFIYFSCNKSPTDKIKKISLSDFIITDTLTFPTNKKSTSAVIDNENHFLYHGITTSPSYACSIVKIDLSTFTVVGEINTNTDWPTGGVIDANKQFIYFGTYDSPAKIVKIRLSDFTLINTITLEADEYICLDACIDHANNKAYFLTRSWSGSSKVVKIDLDTFSRVGAITIDETYPGSIAIDTDTGHLYIGATTSLTAPGVVIKVLDTGILSQIGHLEINSDPPIAEIYIDDYKLSDLTPATIDMPAGIYNLRVHKEGYADYVETIIITVDFTLYRSVTLPYIVTGFGPLDIRSTPPGAKIYIDDVLQLDPYDQPLLTPVMITGISVGSHDIKLTLTGYKDWIDTVPVEETVIIIVDAILIMSNITASAIDIDSYQCPQPCTITVSVIWQNIGDVQDSFDPAIILTKSDNSTTRINIGETITLGPTQFTQPILFTIPNLMDDIYTICPDPN